MRVGSLFSGIGGLELGLAMAGLGPVVWQVEKDSFCRQVLARHWPGVEQHDDVCTVGKTNLVPVDLICGGFPCQDVSSAGARAGLAGARSGLWFEYLRIVDELQPAWVVVENVASGASRWVDTVACGLGQLGYACLPIPIAASDCGAPHRRARIFVVAHADRYRKPARAIDAEVAEPSAAANPVGLQLWQQLEPRLPGKAAATVSAIAHWQSPQPPMVRVVHGVSRRAHRPRRRIKALGNAVVPQCAEVIGWVIRELAARAA